MFFSCVLAYLSLRPSARPKVLLPLKPGLTVGAVRSAPVDGTFAGVTVAYCRICLLADAAVATDLRTGKPINAPCTTPERRAVAPATWSICLSKRKSASSIIRVF